MSRTRRRMLAVAGLLLLVAGILVGRVAWLRVSGNYPIKFYGRIVDANGTGIAGATVDVQVIYSTSPIDLSRWDQRIRHVLYTTDSTGRFEVGGWGRAFSLGDMKWHGRPLDFAMPPTDPTLPPKNYAYDELQSRKTIADDPSRPATYPMTPK